MIAVRKFNGRVMSNGLAAAPDDAVAAQIETLWAAAKEQHPHLFDGAVAGVARLTDDQIEVTWWRYSALVAQQAAPRLFETLKLRPLGVTGWLQCRDGLVLGQRQQSASQDAGLWELAPAGSVDDGAVRDDGTVDLAAALLGELQEELGINADEVTPPHAMVVTDHPDNHVCDVFLACTTALSGAAVETRWRGHGDGEYARIAVVGRDEMAAFDAANAIAPVSRAVLANQGLV